MKLIHSYTIVTTTLLAVTGLHKSNGLSQSKPTRTKGESMLLPSTPTINRRFAVAGLLAPLILPIQPTFAFDNGIPEMEQYKNKDKNPGTQPELGLKSNGKLAMCDDGLNCFSTSGDEIHRIDLWKPKAGSNAMKELVETIKAYPPGQSRVDKGGFSIITSKPDYLYVQFESMKHGFIDDVEFAVNKNSEVQVRSSSRIGGLDLGVNAKRLNWISADLREKGWKAPVITKEDYPDYFNTLVFTFDDYIRSVLYPEYCPVPSQPLECKEPGM